MTNDQLSANERVAETLAVEAGSVVGSVEDQNERHGEMFINIEALPAIRRKADALDCSLATAAYITALEDYVASRVAALEGKVAELRYDVRRVRRTA